MKKIISYSLFEYNTLFDHRCWDTFRHDLNRYFYNIPFVLIQLNVLFEDFQVNFYVEKNIPDDIINLIKLYKNSNIIQMDVGVKGDMSKSMWRYLPLFEPNDVVFPRDIDSVISKEELECYSIFENSNFDVMTIHSHVEHKNLPCRMLAGMSGFKPKNLNLDGNIINRLYEAKDLSCDQNFLINTFVNKEYKSVFLDFLIHDCDVSPNIGFVVKKIHSENSNKMFSLIEKHKLCPWAGYPCDSRKSALFELTEMYNNIELVKTIHSYLNEKPELKSFYL